MGLPGANNRLDCNSSSEEEEKKEEKKEEKVVTADVVSVRSADPPRITENFKSKSCMMSNNPIYHFKKNRSLMLDCNFSSEEEEEKKEEKVVTADGVSVQPPDDPSSTPANEENHRTTGKNDPPFLKMEDPATEIVRQDLKVCIGGLQTIIDTLDRPGKAFTAGTYACAESMEDKSGDGVYAGAGIGHAQAEWSIFDAQAKGPNASAGAELSKVAGVRAFAKAELASASASAGLVKATVGLSADTGVGIGPGGIEAKVLGTGFTIGRKIGISVLGSGIEFKLW